MLKFSFFAAITRQGIMKWTVVSIILTLIVILLDLLNLGQAAVSHGHYGHYYAYFKEEEEYSTLLDSDKRLVSNLVWNNRSMISLVGTALANKSRMTLHGWTRSRESSSLPGFCGGRQKRCSSLVDSYGGCGAAVLGRRRLETRKKLPLIEV